MTHQYETLRTTLKELFDNQSRWGDYQTKSYELIKFYLDRGQKMYLQRGQFRDKFIIIDNLNGQNWYRCLNSSVKLIISQLVDQMRITEEFCVNNETTKLLNLTVDFVSFQLKVVYFQQIKELVCLQICICCKDKKNYLAYFVRGRIAGIPDSIKNKMIVPEISDLDSLLGLSRSMITPENLLKFFLEIVLYYDQTETISNLKLTEDSVETIGELIENLNEPVEI